MVKDKREREYLKAEDRMANNLETDTKLFNRQPTVITELRLRLVAFSQAQSIF